MRKDKIDLYAKIYERAEKLLPDLDGQKLDVIMDIESADLAFDLRLDEWLAADNFKFMHDFLGIQEHIVRDGFPATDFGLFCPIFSGLCKKGTKTFKVGADILVCGLYIGDYVEHIIGRTDKEIVCQDVNYPDSGPTRRAIEIDPDNGSERFLSWEYRGDRAYVYPDHSPENVYTGNITYARA